MADATTTAVGQRLRELRKGRSMTQGDLARALDKTQATVSAWEAGSRSPSVADLALIAEAFDRDLADLLPPSRSSKRHAVLRGIAEDLSEKDIADALDKFEQALAGKSPMPRIVTTPGDDPARAARALVERAAVHGVNGPHRDLKKLAGLCGLHVVPAKFDDRLSGLLATVNGVSAIGVNKTHAFTRQRFSVGHELGHWLLGHHETFHVDLDSRAMLGDSALYDPHLERAANTFAATLLMPADELHERFRAGAGEQPVADLAKVFGVSGLAMTYRLASLGLIDPPRR